MWKAYEHDPMSGGDHRLGGDVADTAVTTVALDGDGNVLSGLLSDGGNTIMGWSPAGELHKRFEQEIKGGSYGGGLVHWWGMIHRVDAGSRAGWAAPAWDAPPGPWTWPRCRATTSWQWGGATVVSTGRPTPGSRVIPTRTPRPSCGFTAPSSISC